MKLAQTLPVIRGDHPGVNHNGTPVTGSPGLLNEIETIHARHPDVCHDDLKLVWTFSHLLQSEKAVSRRFHVVAHSAKGHFQHVQHSVVIINAQKPDVLSRDCGQMTQSPDFVRVIHRTLEPRREELAKTNFSR